MFASSRVSSRGRLPAAAVVAVSAALLAGLTALVSANSAAAAPAAPAHSASRVIQHLAVTSLSFGNRTVNLTAAPGRIRLRWTITDSRAGARRISGTLTLAAPQAGHPGKYVSQQVSVSFALTGSSMARATGSARKSSYSYLFDVPRYARTGTARWQVIGMTVRDSKGDKLTLSASQLGRFKAVLTATEIVQTSGPTFVSLQFAGPGGLQSYYAFPQYAYTGKGAAPAQADVCLYTSPAGFSSGSLELTGPGGRTITTPFTTADRDKQQPLCNYAAEATYGQSYVFSVAFPAGTADGAWTPTTVRLVDAIGNVTTATNVSTDAQHTTNTVTVTGDDVLTASQFAATPNPVDDWLLGPYNITVSMTTAGASGDISATELQFANNAAENANCDAYASNNSPPNVSGGQVSTSFTMAWKAPECDVTGLAIVDEAGNVAVYGSLYGAPDPAGLDVKQVPDTTPPVAASASLSPDGTAYDLLTIGETAQLAPVSDLDVRVYNSSNVLQASAGSDGGAGPEPQRGPGFITALIAFGGLQTGTYTVNFTITDEGGLSNSYGQEPGDIPMPGGPLTFTVP